MAVLVMLCLPVDPVQAGSRSTDLKRILTSFCRAIEWQGVTK